MSNLGKKIVEARTAKGWSQEDLAKRSGVSQGTIGHLESGRNTTSRKLPEIARALGVTVEALASSSVKISQLVPDREPQSWPFKIGIERVLALPDKKLERIEGFITALIEEHEETKSKRHA